MLLSGVIYKPRQRQNSSVMGGSHVHYTTSSAAGDLNNLYSRLCHKRGVSDQGVAKSYAC